MKGTIISTGHDILQLPLISNPSYLVEVRLISTTHNQKPFRFTCTIKHPCKKMTCRRCHYIRKNHFLNNTLNLSRSCDLNYEVGITWKRNGDTPWTVLPREFKKLNSRMIRSIGKFIRVISIGDEKETPHVHYVIHKSKIKRLKQIAESLSPDCTVHDDVIVNHENFLGYLFDQNFIPTVTDPRRPKRLRILSCSRGCSIGFPQHREVCK